MGILYQHSSHHHRSTSHVYSLSRRNTKLTSFKTMDSRTEENQVQILFIYLKCIYRIGKQMQVMKNIPIHFHRQISRFFQCKLNGIIFCRKRNSVRQRTYTSRINFSLIIGYCDFYFSPKIKSGHGSILNMMCCFTHFIHLYQVSRYSHPLPFFI